MNHLTQTLAVEEPELVSIAIRPGTVDTEMQREIREEYHGDMTERDTAKFASLKTNGELLRPDQPGNVMARLVLDAPSSLSGKFITEVQCRLKELHADVPQME
jgi:NAD(P)-dependent dehydrogenase (short-subunit alcohol dehydrogenase family)